MARSILVPDDLIPELEAASRREHRSEADVLRDALRQYFEEHDDIDWPRYIGMAADGSFNAADDEIYLAERWKRE
jgi:metal-responsive CopG/Arc/MetJ family transcriptional regulator